MSKAQTNRFVVLFLTVAISFMVTTVGSYGQITFRVTIETEKTMASTPVAPVLQHRIAIEQIKNPYWHDKHNQSDEARLFWDKDVWDRNLSEWASYGYNGLLYYVEPWQETQWSDLLIRNQDV
jgi:hypothetical protein